MIQYLHLNNININIDNIIIVLFVFMIQVNQVTRSGTILPDLADIVTTGDSVDIDAEYVTAIHVLLVHVISAYLCYIFGKHCCAQIKTRNS